MKRRFNSLALALTILGCAAFAQAEEKMPAKVTYADHVQPILRQKCFSCHNPDKRSGGLDLTNYTNLMQGGSSGEVVEVGSSSGSYLYQLITHEDSPFMPPESPKIPDDMIETVRKWIDGGALENEGSTAPEIAKAKFDLALSDAPTQRPAEQPMPGRLPLEPVVHTDDTTAVTAVATNPWSPIAAIAGQQQVFLYNTQTLQLAGVFPFPEGVPYVLKFSRNGSLLLAGGGRGGVSGRVVVWNIKTGERVFEIGDELDAVLAADISSDQSLIALGGPQRVVRIYSTATGQLVHELRKHTDWIYSLEFSPDAVLLATGDRNGGLFVWEGWTGREYLTLNGHSAGVTGLTWRADSNVLASCSEDGSIRLWEMENGNQVKNWRGHNDGVASIEFARDGGIVSCGRDRVTKLWDQNGSQQRAFEAFSDLALQVSICDETDRVIAGDWTGAIHVWDAAEGKRVGELTTNPPTLSERLAEAEQLLAKKTSAHNPLAEEYETAKAVASQAINDLMAAQSDQSQAKQRVQATTAKVDELKQALEKATADEQTADGIEGLKKQVADAEKEAADAAAALKAAEEKVKQLTSEFEAAQEKTNAAKQAADAAAAELAAAQNQVTRWQAEIELAAKQTEASVQQ